MHSLSIQLSVWLGLSQQWHSCEENHLEETFTLAQAWFPPQVFFQMDSLHAHMSLPLNSTTKIRDNRSGSMWVIRVTA